MITKQLVHQAIDDGLIQSIQQRAQIGASMAASETIDDVGKHFHDGLVKLKQAAIAQHSVVDNLFPE